MAFVGHDSSITVVYPSAPDQDPKAVISISTQGLPFADLLWINESAIVCAGWDCEVMKFEGSESGWQLTGSLEKEGKKGEVKEESALNMFRSMDLKGRSGWGAAEDTKLRTVHQNTVNSLRAFVGGNGRVQQVSTAGVDGRVVVWSL